MNTYLMKDKTKSVLLIEPNLGGHRSVYLAKLAQYFYEKNKRVTIVTLADQVVTPPLKKVLDRCIGIVMLSYLDEHGVSEIKGGFLKNIKRELMFWILFRSMYDKYASEFGIDFIFIPYLDYVVNAIGLLGSPFYKVEFSGICMRQSFHFKDMGVVAPVGKFDFLKKYLFFSFLKKKKLKNVYSIDDLFVEYVKEKKSRSYEKIVYFPDPVEEILPIKKEIARQKLKIKLNEKVLLVYGSLDERKGLKKLFSTLAGMPVDSMPLVVLVGRQSDSISHLMRSDVVDLVRRNGRLLEVNKFVDEDEELMFFSASDAVWCVYDGHYTMSGVVIKAIQCGIGFLACDCGLIAIYANKFNGVVFTGKFEQFMRVFSEPVCRESLPQFHCWDRSLELITG